MLEQKKYNRILILGAHPDDGELGCGATIARFIEEGKELYYAMFSLCQDSVPDGYSHNVLQKESISSSKVLGIPQDNLIFYDYPVRRFPQYRQEILEDMVKLRKDLKPDLVLVSSNQDLHQDHATIANEGWRAFKQCSLLGYESVRNNLSFTAHLFVTITPEQLEKKIKAVKSFESQFFRSYFEESFIKSLAEVRGRQIDKPFAEAFEVIRWIL